MCCLPVYPCSLTLLVLKCRAHIQPYHFGLPSLLPFFQNAQIDATRTWDVISQFQISNLPCSLLLALTQAPKPLNSCIVADVG